MTDEEIQRALEASRQTARDSLLAFTTYTMPTFRPNWHHVLIARALERVQRGEIKRLMIEAPPRHGKSELASIRFPAWVLGREPDAKFISASYNADLAIKMSRGTQKVIDTPAYREVFPGTRLNSKHVATSSLGTFKRTADEFEIVDRSGAYVARGVGGGVTGMGGKYLLIDDPIRGQQDADSPTFRDRVWDWYVSDLSTRKTPDGAIVIIQTRWHEDDLCGRLLEKEGDKWTRITLPAILDSDPMPFDPRQPGEALWGDWITLDFLEAQRSLNPRAFEALYQQRPSSEQGNIFHRDWLGLRWTHLQGCTDWLQSWDLTFKKTKSGSYVVGQVWTKRGADYFLVDQIRERMGFGETQDAIRRMSKQYPQAKVKLIEEKANGSGIIDTLGSEIGGLIPVQVQGDKESRAHSVTLPFRSGNVYLPPRAPWVDTYIHEMTTFPNATHDDQVDATSQALAYWQGKRFLWDAL